MYEIGSKSLNWNILCPPYSQHCQPTQQCVGLIVSRWWNLQLLQPTCGGRVVILLYCPSYFLMEIGLYCRFRQFILRGDVNWALLLFSSVDRLCLAPRLSASDCISICVRKRTRAWPELSRFVCEAEVVQTSFIRCILTTILNRRVVSVLWAGSGCGGSSFRLFRRFEQSRKLST